jgi:hypothetical protein
MGHMKFVEDGEEIFLRGWYQNEDVDTVLGFGDCKVKLLTEFTT